MLTWYFLMPHTISLVKPRSLRLLLMSTMNDSGSVLCTSSWISSREVQLIHWSPLFFLKPQEFVRMKAWMFLLIPGLEAYSNNPHKNGALAKTLYYLSLVSRS
jgi:hypothetical protein